MDNECPTCGRLLDEFDQCWACDSTGAALVRKAQREAERPLNRCDVCHGAIYAPQTRCDYCTGHQLTPADFENWAAACDDARSDLA